MIKEITDTIQGLAMIDLTGLNNAAKCSAIYWRIAGHRVRMTNGLADFLRRYGGTGVANGVYGMLISEPATLEIVNEGLYVDDQKVELIDDNGV